MPGQCRRNSRDLFDRGEIGGRDLRHLETRLARALIAGEVGEDSTVSFAVKDGELVLHAAETAAKR